MKSRLARTDAVLALALLLNGCAPIDSLFPLYKMDDAAFDDHLLGTWKAVITETNNGDKDGQWVFEHPRNDKFYDFTMAAVGTKGGFTAKARLVRLGNYLFTDFEGDDRSNASETPDVLFPFPMITTHMIGRVWLDGDSLQVHLLGDDWVKKQIKAGTFPLSYAELDG